MRIDLFYIVIARPRSAFCYANCTMQSISRYSPNLTMVFMEAPHDGLQEQVL